MRNYRLHLSRLAELFRSLDRSALRWPSTVTRASRESVHFCFSVCARVFFICFMVFLVQSLSLSLSLSLPLFLSIFGQFTLYGTCSQLVGLFLATFYLVSLVDRRRNK